jgi:hypothetical protein
VAEALAQARRSTQHVLLHRVHRDAETRCDLRFGESSDVTQRHHFTLALRECSQRGRERDPEHRGVDALVVELGHVGKRSLLAGHVDGHVRRHPHHPRLPVRQGPDAPPPDERTGEGLRGGILGVVDAAEDPVRHPERRREQLSKRCVEPIVPLDVAHYF